MNRMFSGRFVWGLSLVLVGVCWFLTSAGIATVSFGDVMERYWPVIFIYFGAAGMFSALRDRTSESGSFPWASLTINLAITLVFMIVLGNTNAWWDVDLSNLWKFILPAVVIFLGVTLMTGRPRLGSAKTYVAVMSGSKDVRTDWDDLTIVNVMGGTEVDFSKAGLPEREIFIDAYSVMGGGDLFVPPGVKVICETTSLLGGVSVLGHEVGGLIDRRVIEVGEGPVIRMRCLSVMGGIDVVQRPPGTEGK